MRLALLIITVALISFPACGCSSSDDGSGLSVVEETEEEETEGEEAEEEETEGEETVETEEHDCMVSFSNSGSYETFYVAVRDEYKSYIWFVFRIRHYVKEAALEYANLWRVDWGYKGKYDSETGAMENILDQIITSGENECVFKDYGTGLGTTDHVDTYDFTGGYHGDERIDIEDGCGATFYVDGVALTDEDLSKSFDWVACDSFSYTQVSTMHKTASKVDGEAVESDHHVVADHVKTTSFGSSGYTTENKLVFRDSIDFYWYLGICCVGTAIAERGCNEDMSSVAFDRSGVNRLEEIGKCEYYAWSDTNETEVHIVSTAVTGCTDDECKMFIWDTSNYAKFYRRYPSSGAHTTTEGEVFESEMSVTLSTR